MAGASSSSPLAISTPPNLFPTASGGSGTYASAAIGCRGCAHPSMPRPWRSSADDSLDVQSLVLAEHPDGSGRWLEIQRPLHVDEQDLAFGLDTYCLVTEEQATHHGGVLDWRIKESTLHLDLARQRAERSERGGSESPSRSQSAPRSRGPCSCCSLSAASRQHEQRARRPRSRSCQA